MNIQDTITIASSPFNLPINFAKYCVIKQGAGVINLSNPLQGLSTILFSNISSTSPILINYNDITVSILNIGNFSILFPDTAGNPPGTWVVLATNYVPIDKEAWTVNGETGVVGGVLGTLDNNNWSIIRGNISYMNMLSSSVNMFTNLSFNNVDSPSSQICIKQQGEIDSNFSASVYGLKFQDSNSTDGFYMGFDVASALGFYSYGVAEPYQKMAEFAPLLASIYTPLSMKSQLINFLADPIAIQDAATKNYVDNKYTTNIGQIFNTTSTSGTITFTSPLTATTKVIVNIFYPAISGGDYYGNTHFLTAANYPAIGFGGPTCISYGYNTNPGPPDPPVATIIYVPSVQLIFSSSQFIVGSTSSSWNAFFLPETGGAAGGVAAGFTATFFQ